MIVLLLVLPVILCVAALAVASRLPRRTDETSAVSVRLHARLDEVVRRRQRLLLERELSPFRNDPPAL